MHTRWLSLLLLAVLSPSGALAQGATRSDSLSRDLVAALLGGTSGARGIELLSGMHDERLPVAVFRQSEVLEAGIFHAMAMTVAYFPWPPQETLDSLQARLTLAGWLPPNHQRQPTRGFVGPETTPDRQAYCRDTDVVVPTASVRTLERTLVVLTRQWEASSVAYSCSDRRVPRLSPLDDTPLPALRAPAGGTMEIGSVTPGEDTWHASATLSGRLTMGDVMAHYTGVFVAAGWTLLEDVRGTELSAVAFRYRSPDGQQWQANLMGHAAFGRGRIHLTLELVRA